MWEMRLELTSMVQADDIGKTTENGFEQGEYQYSLNGNTDDENDDLMIDSSNESIFEGNNLQELYENLKLKPKPHYLY